MAKKKSTKKATAKKRTTPAKPDRSELAQLVKRANSRIESLRKKGYKDSEALKSAMISIDYIYKNINIKGGKPSKFVTPTKAWANAGVDVEKTRGKVERAVRRFLEAPTSTITGVKQSREKRIETFKEKYGLSRKLTQAEAKAVFELMDFVQKEVGKGALASSEVLEGTMKGYVEQDGEEVLKDIHYISEEFARVDSEFPEANINEWKPAVYREYLEKLANGLEPDPGVILRETFSYALEQSKKQAKRATASQEALEAYFDEEDGLYD